MHFTHFTYFTYLTYFTYYTYYTYFTYYTFYTYYAYYSISAKPLCRSRCILNYLLRGSYGRLLRSTLYVSSDVTAVMTVGRNKRQGAGHYPKLAGRDLQAVCM
jgi:hypothetical protein